MGQPRPLFCLFSFLSNTIFYRKNFSGIRTRIVWVEGEHADHLRPPRSSPAFVCYLIFVQMKIEKDLRWKDSAPIWRSIVRSFVGAIFKISPTLYPNEADTRSVWPDWAQFCQLCKILRCWQSFYALLSIWQNCAQSARDVSWVRSQVVNNRGPSFCYKNGPYSASFLFNLVFSTVNSKMFKGYGRQSGTLIVH